MRRRRCRIGGLTAENSSEDAGNKTDDGATIAHFSTEMTLGANLWGLKLITKGLCTSLTASWWLGPSFALMQVVQVFPATAKGKGKQRGSPVDGDWVILLMQRKVT